MSGDSSSSLHEQVLAFDRQATVLFADTSCEWVRSRIGIIGLIALEDTLSPETMAARLAEQIVRAHAQLDALPESLFSFDDMWNVILLIGVPWTEEESESDPVLRRELLNVTRDLSGSRKIVLWRNTPVPTLLGPLAPMPGIIGTSSEAPLRDVIQESARDDVERGALEVLFKRRITESDLDTLIRALGREGLT